MDRYQHLGLLPTIVCIDRDLGLFYMHLKVNFDDRLSNGKKSESIGSFVLFAPDVRFHILVMFR